MPWEKFEQDDVTRAEESRWAIYYASRYTEGCPPNGFAFIRSTVCTNNAISIEPFSVVYFLSLPFLNPSKESLVKSKSGY